MSEVQRYRVLLGYMETGIPTRRFDVVLAEDFDAQRLRADTAEAERDALRAVLEGAQYQNIEGFYGMGINDCKMVGDEVAHITKAIQRERNSLRSELAAAEQRIAEMLELLRDTKTMLASELSYELCHNIALHVNRIDAALNPNPEAESHE